MSGHDALAAQLSPSTETQQNFKFCIVNDVVGTTVTVMYEGQPMTFGPERIYCGLPTIGQMVCVACQGQDRFIIGKRLG